MFDRVTTRINAGVPGVFLCNMKTVAAYMMPKKGTLMRQIAIRAASAFVILSVLVVQSASACFWDRDTLAMEAEHFPGITEIITGRFDRFPPLYYEMRLERVAKQLESHPDNLELYDDAGVACDRLGRHDEAIEWMAKKRAVLDALNEPNTEHEYRYLANLGTMHIHRWLSNGANREDMTDAKLARELIAKAIELNPDAHFGRERYQLLAIEWILNADQFEYGMGQSILNQIPELQLTSFRGDELASMGFEDAPDGLMGLIVLGNAWQSIDVYYALVIALGDRGDAVLASLCMIRIRELVEAGHQSLFPDFDYLNLERTPGRGGVDHAYVEELGNWFERARDEAESWLVARNAYITERLGKGQHPDTNPEFWADWHETTSPPKFPAKFSGLIVYPTAIIILMLFGFLVFRVVQGRAAKAA